MFNIVFWSIVIVFPARTNGEANTWCFKMNGKNQKAPDMSQIESPTAQSVKECLIKCGRKFPDCHSVSYNDQTNECILQTTFSHDPTTPPIDAPGFEFLDMKDPVDVCVSENPCKNNATCIDYFGFDYTCNCTSEIYASVNCTKLGQVLLIGSYPSQASIEIYNTEEPANSKILSTSLTQGLYGHVSGVFDNGVVAIVGGEKSGVYSSDTELYDTKQDQIIAGPSASQVRFRSAAVVLNNQLYVCGGYAPPNLRTCEKLFFNQSINQYQWQQIPQMNSVCHAPAMVAVNGSLFVIGGHDGSFLDVVERYDMAAESWNYVNPMPTARNRLAAAELNGKIYVCGGFDDATLVTNICEKYDPMTDLWTAIASMNKSQHGLSLLSVGGKMYAFGGMEVWTPIDSVEEYDLVSNTWTIVEPIKIPRTYQAAVLLN